MIVYYPCWFYFPTDAQQLDTSFSAQNDLSESFSPISEVKGKWDQFEKMFEEELKLKKKNKKWWTHEEDRLLETLVEEGKDWVEISKIIQETTPDKCQRRLKHICSEKLRWPSHIDSQIVSLFEQGFSWTEIASTINQNQDQSSKLNSKQVKERYIFHLKPGICLEPWTIEEDLQLLALVYQNGKSWKSICQKFTDRTELQVKNRYYGTLKFIQQRVLQKLSCAKVCG